jgi:hypothetical protein
LGLLTQPGLGLLRESRSSGRVSAQPAWVMRSSYFTLPDLLVGILFVARCLIMYLPLWAEASPADQQANQKRLRDCLLLAQWLLGTIVFVVATSWAMRWHRA